jgi:hypothetical protein
MNNQGLLQTQGGAPVSDGVYDLTFSLYATQSSPVPAWTEKVAKVAVQNGFYSAVLGQVTPFPGDLFRKNADLWLGVKVDTGNELPRARILTLAYAFEADHAMLATAAEGLTCSGCVQDKALGFDLCLATAPCEVTLSDLTCTAGQFPRFVGGKWTCDVEKTVDQATVQNWSKLVCYDTPTELRAALDAIYAPLVHKHAGADITSPVNQALQAADALALEGKTLAQVLQAMQDANAAAGYLKKTDKLDQSQLPANGLDEVSNGLLTDQFQDTTASTDVPVSIHDYYPPGVTATLTFPDVGTAEKLTVTVSLTNSDVSGLTLQLKDPAGKGYTLYDKGKTGGTLTATWPEPTPTVSGDLTTWVNKNPKGTWTLTIIDSHFDNKTWPTPDGQVTAFSVTAMTLSARQVQVNGNLVLNGGPATRAVAGEPIDTTASGPLAIYVSPTDKQVHLAAVNTTNEWAILGYYGFALGGQRVQPGGTVLVQSTGVVTGFSSLSVGSIYHLGSSSGGVSASPGAIAKPLGMAVSTTGLHLVPLFDQTTVSTLDSVDSASYRLCESSWQLFHQVSFGGASAVHRFTTVSAQVSSTSQCTGGTRFTSQVAGGTEQTLAELTSTNNQKVSQAIDLRVPAGTSVTFRHYGRYEAGGSQYCRCGNYEGSTGDFRVQGTGLVINAALGVRPSVPW